MNRTSIALLAALSVAAGVGACSQSSPSPVIVGSAGAPSTAAGSPGVAGADTTAGTSDGVAGAPVTAGGDGSVAGAAPAAGDTGAGGSVAGTASGGTSSGGSNTAGSPATAGTTSAAGSTSTAGAGSVTVASIVPTLDGFLWVGMCDPAEAGQNKDCPISSDSGTSDTSPSTPFFSRGSFQARVHQVGGTTGTKYTINFEVRGVIGGKNYNGGKRRSTVQTPVEDLTTGNDGWYVGGLPTDTKWNTYEIHVTPPVPGQLVNTQKLTCPAGVKCPTPPDNVYYANSIIGGDGFHETYPVRFSASFPVLGGGTITLIMHDSNALGQQNCGAAESTTVCTPGPRVMDLSGMMPQPTSPAGVSAGPIYSQATSGGAKPFYPQWLAWDVKTVTQP